MQLKALKRELTRDGYTLALTNGGHVKITHPAMLGHVIMADTPSDRHAESNIRATLRRKRREFVETRARRMMMTGE